MNFRVEIDSTSVDLNNPNIITLNVDRNEDGVIAHGLLDRLN